MAWQVLLAVGLVAAAVAAAAPSPIQELPSPRAAQDLVVPAPNGSNQNWTVHTTAPDELAARGFAQGIAMMQGVRGTLVAADDPDADIVVHWVVELMDGQRLGQHLTGTPTIEVARGDSHCGAWVPYDHDTIALVVAHEIGHAMGLPHGPATSVMAEHLPVSYAQTCPLNEGSMDIGVRQVSNVGFTLGATRTIQYVIEADRPVDVCITPADAGGLTGWSCQSSARFAEGTAVLVAGEYDLRVRCSGWWGGCAASYSLVRL